MKRYARDPFWLAARYAGKCAGCGEPFARGAEVFYYPNGRKTYSGECARAASEDFQSLAAYEDHTSRSC